MPTENIIDSVGFNQSYDESTASNVLEEMQTDSAPVDVPAASPHPDQLVVQTEIGDLDEDVLLIQQLTPMNTTPTAKPLTARERRQQLDDACTQFMNAWSGHPQFHNCALVYIMNGKNCINGSSENKIGSDLQDISLKFATTYGSNVSGAWFGSRTSCL